MTRDVPFALIGLFILMSVGILSLSVDTSAQSGLLCSDEACVVQSLHIGDSRDKAWGVLGDPVRGAVNDVNGERVDAHDTPFGAYIVAYDGNGRLMYIDRVDAVQNAEDLIPEPLQ